MCKVGIYLVCDYPDEDKFLKAVEVCERYKIDFLEVGFPFSDPVADGPVIEKAAFEVLKKKNTNNFLNSLKEVRAVFSKKLYVMTYANVVFGYGVEKFAHKVEFIDGIIIADLPFCESGRFYREFRKYDVNLVRFVTPESSYDDIDKIKKSSEDFIYFVSTRGITGGVFAIDEDVALKITRAKEGFNGDVILGFGIRNKEDIKKACEYADGVVIGTKSVESLNEGNFEEFIKSLR